MIPKHYLDKTRHPRLLPCPLCGADAQFLIPNGRTVQVGCSHYTKGKSGFDWDRKYTGCTLPHLQTVDSHKIPALVDLWNTREGKLRLVQEHIHRCPHGQPKRSSCESCREYRRDQELALWEEKVRRRKAALDAAEKRLAEIEKKAGE